MRLGWLVKILAIAVALSGALGTASFDSDPTDALEGEYIVVLRPNSTAAEREHVVMQLVSLGGEILNVYKTVLSGFAARLGSLEEKLLPFLLEHPLVAYVERNRVVRLNDDCASQTNAPWGLGRISNTGAGINQFNYNPSIGGDGAGVAAYVIDTGIQLGHVEFEGRAVEGFTAFSSDPSEPLTDCNGHGTHVAGTIGGANVGVAKKVDLVSVKVLSCAGSGATSGVIAGVDYSAQDCEAGTQGTNRCVANLSLGGLKSGAMNSAVNGAVENGIVMVVAAGNEDGNACLKSPASAADAITVGATEEPPAGQKDARAYFSNFGPCVDIFAPGVAIYSAWIDEAGQPDNEAYLTISGTSMASPHGAGVIAQYLANNAAQGLSPAASEYKGALLGNGQSNTIKFACDGNEKCTESPDLMLQSLAC